MSPRRLTGKQKSLIAVDLGQVIADLRKRGGYSQEEFAERVDLAKNYVVEIERGEKEASLTALETISKALSVTLSKLLKDAGR